MHCVAVARTELWQYHDQEWDTPVHGEAALFEALASTYFENGLSWSVVFHKRAALRRAFADFEPAVVAHSFIQAVGIDNGHFDGCFRAPSD